MLAVSRLLEIFLLIDWNGVEWDEMRWAWCPVDRLVVSKCICYSEKPQRRSEIFLWLTDGETEDGWAVLAPGGQQRTSSSQGVFLVVTDLLHYYDTDLWPSMIRRIIKPTPVLLLSPKNSIPLKFNWICNFEKGTCMQIESVQEWKKQLIIK